MDKQEKQVLVDHFVERTGEGEYKGRITLLNPETGEVIQELKPQTFYRCNAIYAAYKLLINSIRFIADLEFNVIILQSNLNIFAHEIAEPGNGKTLNRQIIDRCRGNGIHKIIVR